MSDLFTWRGKEFRRISDVIDEGLKLEGPDLDDLVQSYYGKYPNGPHNVGYCSGYYSPETAALIQKKFRTAHPIFGNTQPTPEEAFKKGVEMGTESSRRGISPKGSK